MLTLMMNIYMTFLKMRKNNYLPIETLVRDGVETSSQGLYLFRGD
jgi:hypothetical protein